MAVCPEFAGGAFGQPVQPGATPSVKPGAVCQVFAGGAFGQPQQPCATPLAAVAQSRRWICAGFGAPRVAPFLHNPWPGCRQLTALAATTKGEPFQAAPLHSCPCALAPTRTHADTATHTHSHTQTYAHADTHRHTDTQTHTHTHTHACLKSHMSIRHARLVHLHASKWPSLVAAATSHAPLPNADCMQVATTLPSATAQRNIVHNKCVQMQAMACNGASVVA
jgi:hypothetical protein